MPRNVIISAAITVSIHTPTMSPYLPITPERVLMAIKRKREEQWLIKKLESVAETIQKMKNVAENLQKTGKGIETIGRNITRILSCISYVNKYRLAIRKSIKNN